MHNADLPTLMSSAAASTTYGMAQGGNLVALGSANAFQDFNNGAQPQQNFMAQVRKYAAANPLPSPEPAKQQEIPMANARRLVQVFIADPNENIPLDQCVLYSGDQKLTDATDQELFFEIDIKGILEKHNEKRVKIADKKVKERVEHLEPAKVRDLKMVVVTVAQF